jgi:heavy metal efflux system protein
LADELMNQAIRSLAKGEIDFLQYVQIVENSKAIEMRYLNSLLMYNFSALELNYLID